MASIIGSGERAVPARTAAWWTLARGDPWIVSPQSTSSVSGVSRRTCATRVAAPPPPPPRPPPPRRPTHVARHVSDALGTVALAACAGQPAPQPTPPPDTRAADEAALR